MKKVITALFLIITFINIKAQFTTLWEQSAGSSYSWFSTTLSNTTALAYNPVTNKVLIGDRSNLIAILNVTTGNSEGTLNTTGVGSESYKWNKLRVTSDGVIYGISMVTAAGTCKIYRWANQTAIPTLCATFTTTERCGDAFGLSGSGVNTVLYASGNGITSSAVNIYVLTTLDGENFTLNKTLNIPITGSNAWAGRSVDPITTGTNSDLWIRSQNTNTRRINSNGIVQFTSTDGSGANQVPANFSNARYFQASNSSKYLAMFGTNSQATGGLKLRVLNVTDEGNIIDVGSDSLSNTFNTNTSGIGDACMKDNGDGTFTIFYLLTNNGVKAVKTQSLVPIQLDYFNGVMNEEKITLNWKTLTEQNNQGFEIEKSTNGVNFYGIGFINSKAVNGNSNIANYYSFSCTNNNLKQLYFRLKQVDKDGKFMYSTVISLIPKKDKITTIELNNNILNHQINLFINTNSEQKAKIYFYQNNGMLINQQTSVINIGTNNIMLNTNYLPKGLLFLKIETEQQTKTFKILN